MSIEVNGEAGENGVYSHGTVDTIESGETILDESAPLLANEEISTKSSHGVGFFWIQAGRPFMHPPHVIAGGRKLSTFNLLEQWLMQASDILKRLPSRFRRDHNSFHLRSNRFRLQCGQHHLLDHDIIPHHIDSFSTPLWTLL